MKKILMLIFPVLVLALLLTGCFGKKTTTVGQQPQAESYESISGSLDDLIKLGKNYRCVLVAKEGSEIISGTNYVSGDKVRSDFEMKYSDEIWHSHSIVTKDWMYSWIEEMPGQATKIKIADMEKYKDQSVEKDQAAQNYDVDFDYKCYAWSVDQSKFTPPVDINFMDMSDIIKQMGITDEAKGEMDVNCSVCDMIADEATRNTCRQSLNCK